jgi:hypothetical protein
MEFALVSIFFFPLFFIIIEFALIVASIGTYDFAARDAARIGSILGRQKTTTVVDTDIVTDVQNHAKGFVMATAQEVDVYRAAADGNCLNQLANSKTPASEVPVDDNSCIKDKYTIAGSVVTTVSQQWLTDNRDDSLATADYLGVRVVYQYTSLTGFIAVIGSTINLSSTSVQRIEPQQFQGFHGSFAASAMSGSGRDLSASAAAAAPLSWLTRALAHVLWRPTWDRWALEQL